MDFGFACAAFANVVASRFWRVTTLSLADTVVHCGWIGNALPRMCRLIGRRMRNGGALLLLVSVRVGALLGYGRVTVMYML